MARSAHPWRKLERNVKIYIKHEYLGYSYDELATEYNISVNRVSQIVRAVYYRDKHGDDEYVAAIDSLIGNSSIN